MCLVLGKTCASDRRRKPYRHFALDCDRFGFYVVSLACLYVCAIAGGSCCRLQVQARMLGGLEADANGAVFVCPSFREITSHQQTRVEAHGVEVFGLAHFGPNSIVVECAPTSVIANTMCMTAAFYSRLRHLDLRASIPSCPWQTLL